MTIASEITRLQNDKEAMRQSIINKGVDVAASVNFDDYAACIAEISSGPKTGYVDVLIVGGGGSGGTGGGGGGAVIECTSFPINSETLSFPIQIGAGSCCRTRNGCNSSALGLSALGGGSGGGYGCCGSVGCSGGTGGGGGGGGCNGGTGSQGGDGGKGSGDAGYGSQYAGGGGGGAGGNGCNGYSCRGSCCQLGGNGGIGKSSSISGEIKYYGGGGGGIAYTNCSIVISGQGGEGGLGGGGHGAFRDCTGCDITGIDATYYGGGGGGGNTLCACRFGNGYQGVVIIRYKTDGSCKICNTSAGGCKYTCGDYTIHCFTNTAITECFFPVFK